MGQGVSTQDPRDSNAEIIRQQANTAHLREILYNLSLEDTAQREASEAFTLTPLDLSQPTVRMAFLKSNQQYTKFDANGYYEWSPACNEPYQKVANYCLLFAFPYKGKRFWMDDITRTRQTLGLAESWGDYRHLFIVDINPKHLFRPCLDPAVDDATCDAVRNLGHDKTHADWYDEFFRESQQSRIPFTGLGYTYDWGLPRNDEERNRNQFSNRVVGMSEYIIKPFSPVKLVKHVFLP